MHQVTHEIRRDFLQTDEVSGIFLEQPAQRGCSLVEIMLFKPNIVGDNA